MISIALGFTVFIVGIALGVVVFICALLNMKSAINDGFGGLSGVFSRHLMAMGGMALSSAITNTGIVLLVIGLVQKYGEHLAK